MAAHRHQAQPDADGLDRFRAVGVLAHVLVAAGNLARKGEVAAAVGIFEFDHSVVEDVVWGETTYSDKYGFSILKNMQAIQAEQVCRTPQELKEVRANYEKRLKEGK